MNQASKLIDDHIDGELTGDDARQLGEWLGTRDEHVREFATRWLIHSLLHDYMSQRLVQADALLRALTSRGEPLDVSLSADVLPSPATRRPSMLTDQIRATSPPYRRYFGGDAGHRRDKHARLFGDAAKGGCDGHSNGQLSLGSNCTVAIADGALLREGDELRLVQGRALVNFVSGARVIIEGPTALTVQSRLSADLASGVLTASVPGQAIGFAVHAPRARLVDLGTEFTVRTHPDGALELQVFDGMVELTLLGRDLKPDDSPLSIAEGTAVKTDATTQKAVAIPYDETQRLVMP